MALFMFAFGLIYLVLADTQCQFLSKQINRTNRNERKGQKKREFERVTGQTKSMREQPYIQVGVSSVASSKWNTSVVADESIHWA
jgi:hypothetical protein